MSEYGRFDFLKEDAAAAAEYARGIRRDLHRHPELSHHEVRTVQRVCEELEKLGIEHYVMDDIHAVVGIIRSGKPGKTVALRGDMDALPIQENTGLPFASENPGVMHACGHDIHTSLVLGAASVLMKHRDAFTGNVKLFFQPNEEDDGGALPMIQRGCLEDPHVDAAFALHVTPLRDVGQLHSRRGIMHASVDRIKIDVYGTACHGAHPNNGVDAIWIASQVIGALYGLQARRVDPTEPLVLNVGWFRGGMVNNIVCDHAEMGVTMRCIKPETRARFKEELVRLVEDTAASLGGRAEVDITPCYICVNNNSELYDRFQKVAAEVLGPDALEEMEAPSMGVEDFAFFADHVPAVLFNLGTGSAPGFENRPLHSDRFTANEDAFKGGIMMHCALALDYLNDPLF